MSVDVYGYGSHQPNVYGMIVLPLALKLLGFDCFLGLACLFGLGGWSIRMGLFQRETMVFF